MGRDGGLRQLKKSEVTELTVEGLREIIPRKYKHNVTPHLVDELNRLCAEPEARDAFRENLVGYSSVLQDKNVQLSQYIEAVRYVSYKLLGYTNKESWMKTFPDRLKRLVRDKKDDGFIRSTVACYNRNKIVVKIMEQTMVPIWVLNQDTLQRAINVQAQLMLSAKSEKVRSDAANSLMTHLKQPEATKVSLDVHVKGDESIQELREVTLALARQQQLMIKSGATSAKEVAESKVLSGDFERVN